MTTAYRFDEELAPLLAAVPRREVDNPVAVRRQLHEEWLEVVDQQPTPESLGVALEDQHIPGPDGTTVRLRIYRPLGESESLGAVLHLHSGGFYSGTLETERWQAMLVASEVGVPVVSVEYRLAPEHPYPAGLLDCWSAVQWLVQAQAGCPAPIVVLGSSAGGALAASLCHLARRVGGPEIALQCLVCPVMDDRLESASITVFRDAPSWDGASCDVMWRHYLPDGYGPARPTGDDPGHVSVLAAPGRANDLRGLPAAFVAVAEYDPLRDEGLAYAAALARSGVAVELRSYPGVVHGFESIAPQAGVSASARRHLVEAIRSAVLRPSSGPRVVAFSGLDPDGPAERKTAVQKLTGGIAGDQ